MSDAEKKPYDDEYKEKKKIYDLQKQEYEKTYGKIVAKRKK